MKFVLQGADGKILGESRIPTKEEVVYCCECVKRGTYECMGKFAAFPLEDDDWCSWGKAKED